MHEWEFPSALRRAVRPLLHQQCWCWGNDIRHQSGNLLLTYGFTRTRCDGQEAGGSRYALSGGSGETVLLWGFGLVFAAHQRGAVFLDRYDACPMLLSPEAPCGTWHRRDEVTGDLRARSRDDADRRRHLFVAVCRWIADYEAWVRLHAGTSYRRVVLAGWTHTSTQLSDPEGAWRQLATRADQLLGEQLSPVPAASASAGTSSVQPHHPTA